MRKFGTVLVLGLATLLTGCGKKDAGSGDGGGDGAAGGASLKKFISIGSAPTGGTFFVVGGAFEKVLNESGLPTNATNEATKGSRENIIRLQKGEIDFGMSNAAITYFAVKGESEWEKAMAVRSVITMAPNVAQFVTKSNSGIAKLADLKGKRVFVGPAGAGFAMFLTPILKAHGVEYSEFTPVNGAFSDAVGRVAPPRSVALGGALVDGSLGVDNEHR